jgi:hypothetical protein
MEKPGFAMSMHQETEEVDKCEGAMTDYTMFRLNACHIYVVGGGDSEGSDDSEEGSDDSEEGSDDEEVCVCMYVCVYVCMYICVMA